MRSPRTYSWSTVTLFLGAWFAIVGFAAAQDSDPADKPAEKPSIDYLSIGDEAPELDIDTWLTDNNGLFVHTTKFESGQVYVIDLWAKQFEVTVRPMPVLAKLQRKYEDQVQIITVGDLTPQAAEEFLDREFPGAKPTGVETYRDLVEGYCVTTDPDGSVFNDYFRASKRNTVPCSFIVGKDGKIEWIGSTLELAEPLSQVVEGKWDRKAFAAKYDKEMAAVFAQMEANQKVAKIIRGLPGKMREGPDAGLEYLQEQVEESDDKQVKRMVAEIRLTLMIRMGNEQTPQELRSFADLYTDEQTAGQLNDFVWGIYEQHEALGNVPDELLRACRYAAEVAVKFDPKSGAVNDTVAHFVYLDGDLDKAIEWQKKAVANAEGREADLQPFLDKLLKEKETGEKALNIKKPKRKKEKSDF